MNNIIILIPIYKIDFSEFERISLAQAFKIFKKRKIGLILPNKLKNNINLIKQLNNLGATDNNITYIYFQDHLFSSICGYNILMLSADFYNKFIEYKYMLIYQTDAFIFKDELDYFINKNYDYIGAPWSEMPFEILTDKKREKKDIRLVGNGGLSLRKIESYITVLNNKNNKKRSVINILLKFPKKPIRTFIYYIYMTYKYSKLMNEDVFWSYFAQKTLSDFKTAPIEEAVKFAFEMNPSDMFKMNGNKLPFGCHAWWKYDINFWKPFIESFGYKINK